MSFCFSQCHFGSLSIRGLMERTVSCLSDGKYLFRLLFGRVFNLRDIFIRQILNVFFRYLQIVFGYLALLFLRLERIHRVASYGANGNFRTLGGLIYRLNEFFSSFLDYTAYEEKMKKTIAALEKQV